MTDLNTTASTDAGGDDLRAALSAAFDAPAETTDAAPQTQADTTTQTAEERARDERGRFAAKETAQAAPSAAQAKPTDQPKAVTAEPAQAQAIEPPASWSAAERQQWPSLHPDVQKAILRRESEAAKGIEQKGTELAKYRPFDEALAPYRDQLALNGVSEAQFVKQLLAAHDVLTKTPAEGIKYLSKQYGVDLASLIEAQAQTAEGSEPIVSSLQQEINALKQQLQQVNQWQQSTQVQTYEQQFQAFAATHPHFDAVRADMGKLMNAGFAADLESAYEKAIALNPQLSAQIAAEKQQQVEAQRLQEAQEKAAKARSAAVSVTGAPSGVASSTIPAESIRGELERAWIN